MNIDKLKERMDSLRSAAERSQGRKAVLEERRKEAMSSLRQLLGCDEGEEKDAIRELKQQVESYEQEATALIEQAERKMRKL